MAQDNTRKIKPMVEAEFRRLMAQAPGGVLLPDDVVKTARDPASPLHRYFTWDDSEAATAWRKHEARMLIKSYIVESEELNIEVRALTSLELDRSHGGGYRFTLDALEDPVLRQQLIQNALNELERIRKRYDHVAELAQVWHAIDQNQRDITRTK